MRKLSSNRPNPLALARLVLVAALSGAPAALAAGEGDPLPPFALYNTNHGLSQVDVNAFTTDSTGYLWLVTGRGLNRFDGNQFFQWTAEDGLRINNQYAVAVAADQSIWTGDVEGGLSHVRADNTIETFDPPQPGAARVEEIVVVGDRVYVSLDETGVWKLDRTNSSYEPIPATPSHVSQMLLHDGIVFVRDDRDIYLLNTDDDSVSEKIEGRYEGMATSPKGELWLGDNDGKYWRWSRDGLKAITRAVYTDDIDRMAIDADDEVWVRSDDLLITPSGEYLEFHGADLEDLLVDKDGVVWVTSGSGLLRYLGSRFTHYPVRTDHAPLVVRDIEGDDKGNVWFGGGRSIRILSADGALTSIPSGSGLPAEGSDDIAFDGKDHMLLAFSDGIYRIRADLSGAAERMVNTEELSVISIRLEGDRWLWLATKNRGVVLLDLQTKKLIDVGFGRGPRATAVELLPGGGVLAAIRNDGIYTVSRDGNERLTLSDGLRKQRFLDIDVQDSENFLISAQEGGLYEVVDGELNDLSASANLQDLNPYVVHRLPNGTVLAGTENGIFHIDTSADRWYQYTQFQGVVSLEVNSDTLYVDNESRVWIGTIDGATRLSRDFDLPKATKIQPHLRPPRRMESNIPLEPGEPTKPADGGLIFDFVAVSTAKPESIEYSYRLDGVESAWSAPTTTPSVRYSGLPAGELVFALRARFHGGGWSETVTLPITSLPHFWQQTWFVALAVLLVLGFTAFVHRYRVSRIHAANLYLQAVVDERTEHLKTANLSLRHEVEERRKSEAAVVAMEAQIRSSFEKAPIGMAMIDADHKVFEFNAAFGALLGLGRSDVPVNISDFVWDHDVGSFDEFLQRIVDKEQDVDSREFDCRRSDDEKLHAVIAASVVCKPEGDFSHALLQIQDVTEARVLTDRLEYQANFDELTGLHNRRAFENALQATLRSTKHQCGYLMFMDLDQFKVVNDTCGHSAGDELLRRVADAVREQVRSGDVIGRLGGDEFGLILPGSKKDAAVDVAERIRLAIENLIFSWNGSAFRIGISIGAVPIQSGGDTAELQQIADAACYSAKEAGRNYVHVVEGDNDAAQAHRGEMRWVQRLTDAMENDKFVLYGQHIVPLQPENRQPERVEILIRMRDVVTRRLIPPGAFLPAAERYNMGIRLDEWVVKHLVDALFVHAAVRAAPRRYWINLSGTSIGDLGFAERILAIMQRASLEPGMVNFEITETTVIRNLEQADRFMRALRELGCKFALDDFGSGLSSFGYLKKLPVDYVKIDGLFVRDIAKDRTDRMFVKSIIDISHSLGIQTVAECVENEQILDIVRELGADFAQGFHVHRPEMLAPSLPANDLTPPSWSAADILEAG